MKNYIISGFKIDLSTYLQLDDEVVSQFHKIHNKTKIYIGSILVESHLDDSVTVFSIDQIRDYSVNDKVKIARHALMKLDPHNFNDKYPELFIISI